MRTPLSTKISILISFFILALAFSAEAQMPYEVDFVNYANGFSSPIDIAHAGDDRLFIVERSGIIRIIDGNGNPMSTPFLDIDNRVHNAGNQSEQGLLGLAFHPNYANNGYFYVHYIANDDDSIISRFSVNNFNSNTANPNSEFQIMEIEQPYVNHNGGTLKFGPDGYLYIGLGDGGSANDPENRAQNTQTLLGKMLRIDIDNGSPYSIPPSNPYANNANVLDEIWAIGLRNPWKFSFDKQTGDLWIGDVGQAQWEEIDFQSSLSPGGENYGWKCFEGNNTFSGFGCNGTYIPPIVEYNHQGFTHCSVTGGYVYRGPVVGFANYGVYFYADYCSGRLWGTWFSGNFQINTEVFGNFGLNISTFGEDQEGNLYVANISTGQILKMEVSCAPGETCPLSLIISEKTDASCFGVFDGTATVEALDGNPPYSYDWPDGQNTPTAIGLTAFSYTVTVTDNSNNSGTATVTIEQPNEIEIDIVEQLDITCTSPGGAMISINGDNPPFSILWSTGSVSMQEFNITQAGTYTVQVTDDNNCSNSIDVVIEEDNGVPDFTLDVLNELDCANPCTSVAVDFDPASANISYEILDDLMNPVDANEICDGGQYELIVVNLETGCTESSFFTIEENKIDPVITSVSGVTSLDCGVGISSLLVDTDATNATYTWADAAQNIVSNTNILEVSLPGLYTLTIRGENSCVNVSTYEISQNINLPIADAGPDGVLTCDVQVLTLGSANSSQGLVYQWTTADGSIIGPADDLFVEVDAAGIYTLTVFDPSNQCESSDVVVVTSNVNIPEVILSASEDALGCGVETSVISGLINSSIIVDFSWASANGVLLGNNGELIVDEAGVYVLTVVDQNNGCSTQTSIEIYENEVPDLSLQNSGVLTCNNTEVSVTASSTSTSGSLVYSWNGPSGFTAQGMTIVVGQAGTYTATITDTQSNCTNQASIVVEENFPGPEFDIVVSGDLTCTNTVVALSIAPSQDVVTWLLPDGSTTTGNELMTTEPGEFCATVLDPNNGCEATKCVFVNENILVPNLDWLLPDTLSCGEDTVSITTFPFSMNGMVTTSWTTNDGIIVAGVNSSVVDVSLAGNYCLTITDEFNGCTTTFCVEVFQAETPAINLSGMDLLCAGDGNGSINSQVTKGSEPFNYNWSNGATSADLNGLSGGVYTLALTDAANCQVIETYEILEPEELTLMMTGTDETGSNFNDGTISTTVTGGVEPYTYIWSNGSASPNLTNLSPGVYELTLTDANGCQTAGLLSIAEFGCTLDFELTPVSTTCFASTDGEISVNILSGNAPYSYLWSTQETGESLNGLSAGKYTLTITDASGCEKTVSAVVEQPEEITASVIVENNIDCANSMASLRCVFNGGTGIFQFIWSNGGTGSSNTAASSGAGSVTLIDENGCELTVDFVVEEDLEEPLFPSNVQTVFCGPPTEPIGFDLGAGLNYSYAWTGPNGFSASTPTIDLGPDECGEYNLVVTDLDNSCSDDIQFNYLCASDLPVVELQDLAQINCISDSYLIEPSPGYSTGDGISYLWANVNENMLIMGEDEPSLLVTTCESFAIFLVDSNTGCSASDTISVECNFETPMANAGEDIELNCEVSQRTIGSPMKMGESYEWQDESGSVIGNTAELEITECGTYTLIVSNMESGCSDTDEVEVLCNDDLPIADAGEAPEIIVTCVLTSIDSVVTLDGTGSSQGAEFAYQWFALGPFAEIISGAETLTPTVRVPGEYTLVVTDTSTGCTASSAVTLDILIDQDIPSIDIELSGEQFDCNNSEITASLLGDLTGMEISWLGPDGFTSSNSEVTITQAGQYTVTILDPSNGCMVIDLIEITNYNLLADLTITDMDPCFNGPVQVEASGIGEWPFEYLWSTGETTQSIIVEEGVQIEVTITDALGCTATSGPILTPISNDEMSLSDFEISPSIEGQATGAIEISVVGGTPPYIYSWSNGGVTSSISGLEPGEYTVTITDDIGCEFIQTFEVTGMPLSIETLDQANVKIYPNPSSGVFYLETQQTIDHLEIYDEGGKLILNKFALKANEVHTYDLSSGVYLIKVRMQDEKEYAGKLLIQK